MKLGAFSVSLTVANLDVSKAFYEKLGFAVTGGNPDHNYVIVSNGTTVIGLYKGMFEKNILTFNPGWSGPHRLEDEFTDVRDLAAQYEAAGLTLTSKSLPEGGGPAYITLEDPDGNPILLDQHR